MCLNLHDICFNSCYAYDLRCFTTASRVVSRSAILSFARRPVIQETPVAAAERRNVQYVTTRAFVPRHLLGLFGQRRPGLLLHHLEGASVNCLSRSNHHYFCSVFVSYLSAPGTCIKQNVKNKFPPPTTEY